MKRNPLQFAMTREDPALEGALVEKYGVKRALLICSAGDTALYLLHRFPDLTLGLVDFNQAQLDHFKKKATLEGKTEDLSRLGNFESLFRQWRSFFQEFILSPSETERLFKTQDELLKEEMFSSPYWPVSFDLFFHDRFLATMFGPNAIQHAPKGTYPRYFQNVFERGLKQQDFHQNPYLQHIFFDRFLETPIYLKTKVSLDRVSLIHGVIQDVPELSQYELIHLSNICDWMDPADIKNLIFDLTKRMKKGAIVLIRQINNDFPLQEFFGDKFEFDSELGEKFYEIDRSLFYSRILVGKKVGP